MFKKCIPCRLFLAILIAVLILLLIFITGQIVSISKTGRISPANNVPYEKGGSVNPEVTPMAFPPGYVCPVSGWVDCMPGPGVEKSYCAPEFIKWAQDNCPNFQGVAY
ncbi:MAG: hypothetical protein AAB874_08120 [Patescibacteria group bacterium]